MIYLPTGDPKAADNPAAAPAAIMSLLSRSFCKGPMTFRPGPFLKPFHQASTTEPPTIAPMWINGPS